MDSLTRLERLHWLRDTIVSEIEAGPQGDKAVSQTAPLARQLRDTLREIAELEKSVPKGSIVDDLKARRSSRGAGAKSPAAPSGRGRQSGTAGS